MRLIDADALEPIILWQDCEGYVTAYSEAEIENAPTIHTKLIKYYDSGESVWKIGEVIVKDAPTEREGE